jgi:hypothetical protein
MPRLNPPPGWPPVPQGWTPPANWQPDPSWPPPPPGWQLWVEDSAAPRPVATAVPAAAGMPAGVGMPGVAAVPRAGLPANAAAVNSLWAMGGGAAVLIGAWLPFVSVSAANLALGHFTMPTSLQVTSALFGLALTLLGLGLRKNPGYGTVLLVLSILGLIGYVGFTAFGIVGIWIFHFAPSIGLILSILGCVAALVGSNRSKKVA